MHTQISWENVDIGTKRLLFWARLALHPSDQPIVSSRGVRRAASLILGIPASSTPQFVILRSEEGVNEIGSMSVVQSRSVAKIWLVTWCWHFAGRAAWRILKSPSFLSGATLKKLSRTSGKSAMARSAPCTTRGTCPPGRSWPSRRCPTWASSLRKSGKTFSRKSAFCASSATPTPSNTRWDNHQFQLMLRCWFSIGF